MNERGTMEDNKKKRSGKISVGVFALSLVLAFVAGNRMQTIGDYFFAPYTNKGNQVLSQNIDFGQVEKTYDILKTKFDGKLDSAKLQDGLQKGLVDAAGDPYTVFLNILYLLKTLQQLLLRLIELLMQALSFFCSS